MDFQEYELLIDLAETKNITKTAENLGYSQPGASHILKKIEKEVGFPIIFREKYGVTLTPAAELMLPAIRELMTCREKLEQMIHSIKGLEYGKMTIGAYSSVSIHLLPQILREFKELHPNLVIDIREGGADNILQWIDANEIDFAFISRPYAKTLDFLSYGQDPLVAVLPKGYALNGEKEFLMSSFEGKPFIISADGNDFDVHRALEVSKINPDYNYSVLDDHTILSMVENKLGLSILTKLICTGYHYEVDILPVKPAFYREMGIGMKDYKKLSPAAKSFVDFAMKRIPNIWNEVLNK
jgi:DNA-binding transcriptional LysR family regulator